MSAEISSKLQLSKAHITELQKASELTFILNFIGNLPQKDPHMV